MRIIPDKRRLRIYQVPTSGGLPRPSSAADVWQTPEGDVMVSGLWGGLVPLMPEDMNIRASRMGMSSLEWLRQRLLLSPMVEVEVID